MSACKRASEDASKYINCCSILNLLVKKIAELPQDRLDTEKQNIKDFYEIFQIVKVFLKQNQV